jgi:environmental stress-induced protein Ves
MRVMRSSEYRLMPWRNGGGETMEVAVSPPGAGLDEFDWRVSMARVASDGPFSLFPGIDRTLMITDGRGIRLAIDGFEPVELTADSEPLSFPGDVAASASLIGGSVLDLNVMTRRGIATHEVTRLRLDETSDLATDAETVLLLCQAGSVQVETPGFTARLDSLDSLRAEHSPGHILALAPSMLIVIEIRRLR